MTTTDTEQMNILQLGHKIALSITEVLVDVLSLGTKWGFVIKLIYVYDIAKSYLTSSNKMAPQFKDNMPRGSWAHSFMH